MSEAPTTHRNTSGVASDVLADSHQSQHEVVSTAVGVRLKCYTMAGGLGRHSEWLVFAPGPMAMTADALHAAASIIWSFCALSLGCRPRWCCIETSGCRSHGRTLPVPRWMGDTAPSGRGPRGRASDNEWDLRLPTHKGRRHMTFSLLSLSQLPEKSAAAKDDQSPGVPRNPMLVVDYL